MHPQTTSKFLKNFRTGLWETNASKQFFWSLLCPQYTQYHMGVYFMIKIANSNEEGKTY
jgi:hypothetical protein